jgi:hypothetical protein
MSVSANRYAAQRTQHLPHRRNSIPLSGDLEDNGKWFKCKVCGFSGNHIERNIVGSGDGVTQLNAVEIATGGVMTGDPLSIVIYVDDMFTMLALGADGLPITNYRFNNYPYVEVIGGCSLCGSKNYR